MRHPARPGRANNIRESGFTLVEMSIVLVIIGLIVGGILVGRDLIKAAQLRAQVSQIGKLDSAINTFRVKYNAIPGDMLEASTYGLDANCTALWNNAGNGNGDGRLDYDLGVPAMEDRKIFCHLYNAGLFNYHQEIGGRYSVPPYGCYNGACTAVPAAISSNLLVSTSAYVAMPASGGPANGFYIFVGGPYAGVQNVTYGLLPFDAYSIDVKLDDGLPLSGSAQSWGLDAIAPNIGVAGSANCVNNSVTPNAYNLLYTTDVQCILGFKMSGFAI